MNPEETCDVCYFWFPDKNQDGKQGECRSRRPVVQAIPVSSMDPRGQKYTVMPLPVFTASGYQCGEWEPIEQEPAPEAGDGDAPTKA